MAKDNSAPILTVEVLNDQKMGWRVLSGCTLRDYFAAKAMQALLQSDSHLNIASESYRFADLMLKEREK
jgi:hypothetical protein